MINTTHKIIALSFSAVLLAGSLFFSTGNSQIPRESIEKFIEWKTKYSKNYASPNEHRYRMFVFHNNLQYINQMNKAQSSFALAINKFADLTKEEFLAKYTGASNPEPEFVEGATEDYPLLDTTNLPPSVNWTAKGYVTDVKNQGQCGSCWSFSAAGALESYHALVGGNLTSLSNQQLMDCSGRYGSHGCLGGPPVAGFQYVMANGIETLADYPYEMKDGPCRARVLSYVFGIKGFNRIPKYDNDQLKAAVVKQPIAVSLDADVLQFYSNGVIKFFCGQIMGHAVVLTGYDTTEKGEPFWILKNSWGPDWGLDGYFWVERKSGIAPSECGISKQALYPTGGYLI